jgi:arsenate reductase (glutaredoxin)
VSQEASLVVYEKPTCTTCRRMRKLLEEEGVDFERVDYFVDPIPEKKMRELLRKAGLRPRDVLRTREARAAGILNDDGRSDDELFALLVEHPELLQRPIVEWGERAVLGRPVENVRELLSGSAG